MTNLYSPHTGEHIRADVPADWMGRADSAAPAYDPQTQACFWRDDRWEIIALISSDDRVPEAIEALQALLALDAAGLAPAFAAWANSPERTFAERAFIDRARTWRRDNPVLIAGAADMGITPEQLDQLFIAGAAIQL